jgi:hypothetical protein
MTMRWHDDYADDHPSSISTNTMPVDTITTKMDGFGRGGRPEGNPLSDNEIEQAIKEINQAIKKYSRFDPR